MGLDWPEGARPTGPRLLPDDRVVPDPIALRDDLTLVADVLATRSDGGTLDYINAKKLTDHSVHTATPVESEESRPLEMKFINVTSNVAHTHKVGEIFSTPLRLMDIRIGYYVEF